MLYKKRGIFMNINEFKETIQQYLNELNMKISDKQAKKFYDYMNLLIEWNNSMNLTSIIEPKEIIIKHFVDSLTIIEELEKNDKIIDVGTGAGFPGIPIKIILPDTKIVLMDSLNKRINFLNEVINRLELKYIEAIHGRAEDLGREEKHREKYDVAIARAVAPLNILLEYLIPFVKTSGKCICMKGSNVKEEIDESKKALNVLGASLVGKKEFNLPQTDIGRAIILIKKEKQTPNTFPRKAGTPKKRPL